MNPLVKFRPTDEHLFAHYLQQKATGAPLPPGLIEECDLYSQEPWRIFDTTSEQTFYVFTTLRKNKSRVLRTAGSGTWKEQHTMRIPDILGELAGYKKSFKFQGGRGSSATSGRWIMYEFSMCDERRCKYVLCKIKFYRDKKKLKDKEIVISADIPVQFEDENRRAKRMCLLNDSSDRSSVICDFAIASSSTVDGAQPATSQAFSSSVAYAEQLQMSAGAYADLLPTTAEQVINDDDEWIDRLMDMDIDPVVDADYLFGSNPFANPSEDDTNAMLASTLGTPDNQTWGPTSLHQQRSVAESQEQDVPATLAWADPFLLV
ncbi:NAC domain-containing protein 41-like [Eucalyptus grandis]|uniref:NAC domain-containing protein 41-like n=1 Tax=Eucalyptus grandis TaxID=71139 RepID=UPI00192EAA9B|nr:NAC domain-containing protein 41-like [Eucalyptus grandis]